jgi:hypothetical protein
MSRKTTIRQRTHVSPRARIWISLVLLIMAACGVSILNQGLHGVGEARKSGSWPTGPGVILRLEMETSREEFRVGERTKRRDRSTFFSARVECEFDVNGATYRGSRIAVVEVMIHTATTIRTHATLNKYPLNQAVTVSYRAGQTQTKWF